MLHGVVVVETFCVERAGVTVFLHRKQPCRHARTMVCVCVCVVWVCVCVVWAQNLVGLDSHFMNRYCVPASSGPVLLANGQVMVTGGDSSGWGGVYAFTPVAGNFSLAYDWSFTPGLPGGGQAIYQDDMSVLFVSNNLGQAFSATFA